MRSSSASRNCAFFSRTRSSLRWIVKSGGKTLSEAFSSRSRSSGTRGGDPRRRAGRRRLRRRLDEVLLGPQLLVGLLQLVEVLLRAARPRRRRDHAALDQRAAPDLADGRLRRDLLVHQRLREARLVSLVVAVAPVADQVDQEVALEARRGRRTPAAPPRRRLPGRRR